VKILLDFSAQLGREDFYWLAFGDESLHENNKNNGVGGVLQCSCHGHIGLTSNYKIFGLLMEGPDVQSVGLSR
jgi:hypothetical protein